MHFQTKNFETLGEIWASFQPVPVFWVPGMDCLPGAINAQGRQFLADGSRKWKKIHFHSNLEGFPP